MADAVRLHRRKHRRVTGQTLLEGPHLLEAAIAARVPVDRVFVADGDDLGRRLASGIDAPVVVVDPALLAHLGTTGSPQSPIAIMPIPPWSLPDGGRVLVAWGVSDPGNCGTLMRTAAAFGMGFGFGPRTADPWSPKVLRSAAGAHFQTPIGEVADLAAVRSGGRAVVATVARGGVVPGPLPADVAILVGSEAHGLPDDVVAAAGIRVTIPTAPGVESLNAAVAGAIVAYLGVQGPGTNLPAP